MKMAMLANYFGLGQQTHRSLDDVRMNLEVVKYCATILFLESSLPNMFTENSRVSPNSTTRSRSVVNSSPGGGINQNSPPLGIVSQQTVGSPQSNPILSLLTESSSEESSSETDPFNMSPLSDSMSTESPQADVSTDEKPESEPGSEFSRVSSSEVSTDHGEFLDPNQVSVASISASFFFSKLLRNDIPMPLRCACLRVRYGLSTKFVDHFGRPRLSIVVDTSPSLCTLSDFQTKNLMQSWPPSH